MTISLTMARMTGRFLAERLSGSVFTLIHLDEAPNGVRKDRVGGIAPE
jgi:hypothetical protein